MGLVLFVALGSLLAEFSGARRRVEQALRESEERSRRRGFDWLGGIMAFKAVLLEGFEVVFIVIAVGAGRGLLLPASIGALAACVVVLAAARSCIVRLRASPRTRSSSRWG